MQNYKFFFYITIFISGMVVGAFSYEKLFVKECPPTQLIEIENNIKAKRGSNVDIQDSNISPNQQKEENEIKDKSKKKFLFFNKKNK